MSTDIDIESEYAIGQADSFGVVSAIGIWDVEYDLKQAQYEGEARYVVVDDDGEIVDETVDLFAGEHIAIEIAKSVREHAEDEWGVYGFVVPDHHLGAFINEFEDLEVFRER